jgi:hypothetical protein
MRTLVFIFAASCSARFVAAPQDERAAAEAASTASTPSSGTTGLTALTGPTRATDLAGETGPDAPADGLSWVPPLAWASTSREQATLGMKRSRDFVFGTGVSAASGQKRIDSVAILAEDWQPLEGAVTATYPSGTGTTTINSEIQRFATEFDIDHHVFEADALRLSTTLDGGTWNRAPCGDLTSAQAQGLVLNDLDGVATTLASNIGLSAQDLAQIEVGQVFVAPPYGLGYVAAKNAGQGTLTLRRLTAAAQDNYRGNWAIQFLPAYFATLAQPFVDNTVVTLSLTHVPAGIAPGMFVLGLAAPGGTLKANDRARVVSKTATTVTFNSKVFSGTGNIATGTGGGFVFIAGVESGQIWSRFAIGPQAASALATAMVVDVTFPLMDDAPPQEVYTRQQLNTYVSTYPNTFLGYWPAVWTFYFKPDGNQAGYRSEWSEVDILEMFMRPSNGTRVWQSNLHEQPFTRQTANVASGSWRTTAGNAIATSANTHQWQRDTGLFDGRKHEAAAIWTKDRVYHYLDGVALAVSEWPLNNDYPHQLGVSYASGALSGGYPNAVMFPMSDAHVRAQHLKVHRVQVFDAFTAAP